MLSTNTLRKLWKVFILQSWLALAASTQILAGQYSLSGDDKWVVIASREYLSEAVSLAGNYEKSKVFKSGNGWYAVVIGPYTARTMDAFLGSYSGPSLPDDTYLARGKDFVSQEWSSETSADESYTEPETSADQGTDESGAVSAGVDAGPATGLGPDEMIWNFRSYDPHIVDVVLHAVSRRRAWPGGDEVYSLKDSNWHSFRLSCVPGEKICFGAGVRGNYSESWGVGVENRSGCSNCCYTCSGNEVSWNLNP